MTKTSALLNIKKHRPFPFPDKPWKYYQIWDDTIFLHWKAPAEYLAELLPEGLVLDTFEGEAYISVVAFTVNNMRPRFLPPFPYLSNFHEVNLRTYVIKDAKPGIYFISIETNKLAVAALANALIGLNYKKAELKRKANRYTLRESSDHNYLNVKYLTLHQWGPKSELDKWLTERYCAYEVVDDVMYRFNIHHKPWPLKKMKVKRLDVVYSKGRLLLNNMKPHLQHFSPRQKVLLWGRERC